jgi:hypothetical protein
MRGWFQRLWAHVLLWLHTHVLQPPPAMLERVRRSPEGTWRCAYILDELGRYTFIIYRGGSCVAMATAPTRALAYQVARGHVRRAMFERGLRRVR